MRVGIATSYVPFVSGGDRVIFNGLLRALRERGHDVETFRIPYRSYWEDALEQILAMRLLDCVGPPGREVERLITIRNPSHVLRHPARVCWFIHHHRGAYDLWGTPYQDIPNSAAGVEFREAMIRFDTEYLRESRAIFTNSRIVAERLREFNGIEPDGVLYPPLPDASIFSSGPYGDYFLYTARLSPLKRQHLAVEAMQHVRSPFRLVLAGAPDAQRYLQELQDLAERLGVADRVTFTGWITDEEKARLTGGARGALYLPYLEDSYGYSTLEAFHAARAVITCSDSGGTDEVIVSGQNGYIVPPDAPAIAQAMEALWAAPARARAMGEAARATIGRLGIDWDTVVAGLLR